MGNHDVRIRLVVAKEDVVTRRKRLDQVVLKQQRLCFRAGNRGIDPRDLRHHQGNARTRMIIAKVRSDPLLQILRLAHIEHLAIRIEHAVDAGQIGQGGQQVFRIEGFVHGREAVRCRA